MSHELRRALAGILGNAHLLRLDGGLTVAHLTRVDAMIGACAQLLRIVEDTPSLAEVGAGLTIAEYLPVIEPARDLPDVQPAGPLVPALCVLVVDDVAMNRDVARSFLHAAGHTVVCVEGGAEAVAAVAANDFDVVLMDVRMPEMDGLEATRRIRALGSKPNQPLGITGIV